MSVQETWEEAEIERVAEPLGEIATALKSIAGSLTVLVWMAVLWGMLTVAGSIAGFLLRTPGP